MIDTGVKGLLDNEDQWDAQIKSLIVDPAKREALGDAARNHVLAAYSPETRRTELEKIMQDIRSLKRNRPDSEWTDRLILRMKLEMQRTFRICRIWLRKRRQYFIRQWQ